MDYEAQIRLWLMQDEMRLGVIKAVSSLSLSDCWVAAGFVRNLVWDKLHHYACPTMLNDIDVIYYDAENTDESADFYYESQLRLLTKGASGISVKNQARMHFKLNKMQYKNTFDSMSYWPEIETAVGVRWLNDYIEFSVPFGLDSLFNKTITFNTKSCFEVFIQRVKRKEWLDRWPGLIIRYK
ncbi:nucleotidyltransferase family protein [Brenneria sp. 4F2]|nr:nucleotidyltransferase family protein [Brenneria bubanii]